MKEEEIFTCPCCFNETLGSSHHFEICEICGWEDDPVQFRFPDYEIGANNLSLNQARQKWLDEGHAGNDLGKNIKLP